MSSAKKKLLFVCVENSNRSQMAEAFARIHGDETVEASSAGSRPSGTINPRAVKSMLELGYDLSAHTSKSLLDIPRSEEHTSELQSLAYLVCRLLLEKKNKIQNKLIKY